MKPTKILLAVVVVLVLMVIHLRRKVDLLTEDLGAGRASSWGAVRESWSQLRGRVLNMVIAGDAGAVAAGWVTKSAPHGKGGSMGRRDADAVCAKACAEWGKNPSVAVFCDCDEGKALDF